VQHYRALVAEERELVGRILIRAEELWTVTIERLLTKSDLQVDLDALAGATDPTRPEAGL
jgi:hypothetical protein